MCAHAFHPFVDVSRYTVAFNFFCMKCVFDSVFCVFDMNKLQTWLQLGPDDV